MISRLLFFSRFAIIMSIFLGFVINANGQKIFDISDNQSITVNLPGKKITAVINTRRKPKLVPTNTYYWYDNTSLHETKGGYSGYLLDGAYKEFSFPGNELLASGEYSEGLKDGSWTLWYDNHQMKERSKWRNGKRHGRCYAYDNSGALESIALFKGDRLYRKKTIVRKDTVLKNKVESKQPPKHKKIFQFFRHSKDESNATKVAPEKSEKITSVKAQPKLEKSSKSAPAANKNKTEATKKPEAKKTTKKKKRMLSSLKRLLQ